MFLSCDYKESLLVGFVLGVGAMAEVPIIVSHVKNHLQRTSDQTDQDVS